jgi:hypothetical protein
MLERTLSSARSTTVVVVVLAGFVVVFLTAIIWATSQKAGEHHEG